MSDQINKSYQEVLGVDFEADPTNRGVDRLKVNFDVIVSTGGTIEKIYDSTEVIQKVYS